MIPVFQNKFFRLPICLAKDDLVVNTGRSSVSSVQFHSHKLLQSWTLKQPHSFSCPVVYVRDKNELVCVINKNVLVIWSYEADNLDGAKKVQFQDTVFAIIPVENQQLIVFNSGSCMLLQTAISESEFIMPRHLKNKEKLLWADASAQESELFVFLLTSCKDGYKLHSLLLNARNGKSEKLNEQLIFRDSLSLKSWCMRLEDAQMSFLSIWSDGQVHSHSNYNKPSEHVLTIPGIQDKEMLAMETLDSCHIVVTRYHPSCGPSYEIWDTKYSTRKAHKYIKIAASENLQVRVLQKTLFICYGKNIVAEPLQTTSSTLSSAVGKSSTLDEMQDAVYSWASNGMLHHEDVEALSTDISSCKFSTITTNEMFQELLSRLHGQDAGIVSSCLREVKLISESKLVKLLQYLLRKKHSEFRKKSSKRKIASKYSKKIEIFRELFCIPFNDAYLQARLRKLLTFQETTTTIEILTMLLKKADKTYDILPSHIQDDGETDQPAMKPEFEEGCQLTIEEKYEMLSEVNKSLNRVKGVLGLILEQHRIRRERGSGNAVNQKEVTAHMDECSSEEEEESEVEQEMNESDLDDSSSGEEQDDSKSEERISKLTNLLNWKCLLFFSHFEEFIMCTEKEVSTMEDLMEVIDIKLEECDKTGLLLSQKKKKHDFQVSSSSLYCIECVYL